MKKTNKTYKQILQRYFLFCPHCGKRFQLKTRDHEKELVCPACGYILWLNSKPTASCFLVNEKKEVLLSKRAIKPLQGWWDVPGGFLKLGETPEAGVKREIQEELGLKLKKMVMLPCAYIGTYETIPLQLSFNIYFVSRISSRTVLTPQDDVCAAKWFSLRTLPKNVAFENNQKALRMLVRDFSQIIKQIS